MLEDNTRDIEIALKPSTQHSQRTLPKDINHTLRNEYATKYLEKINVYPTKNNIDCVVKEISIDKASIKVNWAREKIYINPFGLSKHPSAVVTKEKGNSTSQSPSKSAATADDDEDEIEIDKVDHSKKFDPSDLSEPLLRILKHNRQTANSFKSLMKPPDIDREDILQPIRNFISSVGEYVPTIKLDKTGELFKTIKKLLTSTQTVRLMGLLCHFCYWNVVHPAARSAIIEARNSQHGANTILGTIYNEVDLDEASHMIDRQNIPSIIKSADHIEALNNARVEARGVMANTIGIDSPLSELGLTDFLDIRERDGESIAESSHVTFTGDTIATETSLAAGEKEALYLQLEHCLIDIFKKLGSKKTFLVAARQALISCCHFALDDIFTTLYPWCASIITDSSTEETMRLEKLYGANQNVIIAMKELNIKLRRLLHQGLSDLIDPTRLYTSPTMLNTLVGSTKGIGYKTDRKNKHYNTSTAIKAIFGDTKSDQTKRFFQKSSGLFISLPGVVEPWADPCKSGRGGEEAEESRSLKRINFDNLFTDQEAAEFYPKSAAPPGTASTYQFRGGTTGTLEKEADRKFSAGTSKSDTHRGSSRSTRWKETKPGDEWLDTNSHNRRANIEEISALLDHSRMGSERSKLKLKPVEKMKMRRERFSPHTDELPPGPMYSRTNAILSGLADPNNPSGYIDTRTGTASLTPATAASSSSFHSDDDPPDTARTHSPASRRHSRQEQFAPGSLQLNLPVDTPKSPKWGMSTGKRGISTGRSTGRINTATTYGSIHTPLDRPAIQEQVETEIEINSILGGQSLSAATAASRSMVNDGNAEVQISLRGKMMLMTMMVDKTATIYAKQTKTNKTEQRIKLIRGHADL